MRSIADKTVLFLGHEATRTGAPIALLQLLKWLALNTNIDASCILGIGGSLAAQFGEVCPTTVASDSPWQRSRRVGRLARRFGFSDLSNIFDKRHILRNHPRSVDLVYCNTLAVKSLADLARKYRCPIVVHVHELEFTIRMDIGVDNARNLLRMADSLIACSDAVAQNLVDKHAVPLSKIKVVHGYVNPENRTILKEHARSQLRKDLGWSGDAIIVGGCGTFGWRKGTDLFLQLASVMRRDRIANRPIHFIWLGGTLDERHAIEFRYDVERMGLSNMVSHIPSQPNPRDYFKGMDLFVLPSREDPFPLVCLEAASCGVPIVCFEDAGGMPEFVGNVHGASVPYGDVTAMASAINRLLGDDNQLSRMGSDAMASVHRNYVIDVAGPRIWRIIETCIGASNGSI